MSTELHCKRCGTFLALLRDAKVRNDMVTYCAPCDRKIYEMVTSSHDNEEDGIPEFLRSFVDGLKGRKR